MTAERTIGALAAEAGISVRTLHHYDRIGLVVASSRTGAGHRRYSDDDVRRLYRVRALAQLGVPLAEIDAALSGGSLRDTVALQLQRVTERERELGRLRQRLEHLADALDAGTGHTKEI